jgi:hypothetical protein
MAFPPDVYLIGAAKAGTSTLANLLDQHPRVLVSQPKEPHFFTLNWDRGLDWYASRFPNSDHSICIDASTTYSMAPLTGKESTWLDYHKYVGVPEKVYSMSPSAKFIYILRNPISRTYSAYWADIRGGNENKGFRTSIRENPFYLDVSDYHGQLSVWLNSFPLERFFLVLFEDLTEAPEVVARKCLRFLGVGEPAELHMAQPLNTGYQVTWMGRGINRLANSSLRNHPRMWDALVTLQSKTPESVRARFDKIRRGSKPIPAMKHEDREFLNEYFSDKNQALERLIGISLDRWQT